MCYKHHLSFSLFVAGGQVVVSLFVAGVVFGDLGLSLLQHECRSYTVFWITEVVWHIIVLKISAVTTDYEP